LPKPGGRRDQPVDLLPALVAACQVPLEGGSVGAGEGVE
jgi:hypothetical protein